MTQTIRFGNHDLEICSDDSSFTALFQIIQEFQGLNGIKKYRMV